MAWNDRIREAAYTSPSGDRITFGYENVSKSIDKKTTGFEFPDADGTFVQDLGHTGRKYPLRVFFWGDDYDLEADAFEAALLERGTGKLDHPVYGSVDVVPFGTITRRDDLKTGANQAVIEITLWETIGLVYPTGQTDPASEVLGAVDEYNTAASEEFEDVTDLDSAVDSASFKSDYQSLLDSASSGLKAVADTQEEVQKQFDAVVDSINQGIDILIAQPLTLAFQTTIMLQAPARALAGIEARLDAYKNLAGSIISGDGSVVTPSTDSSSSNKFHTNDLYASTYVAGSVLSAVNNQFETKTEALEAAEEILTQFEDVVAWRDENYQTLGEVDTGGAYQQLQKAVSLTAGFLVDISFSLKQERALILDRDRTIIDLSAELYGSVDDKLDFLINSNNLTGSEILEIPKGREIVYYI
jgi:Mu-like prophage DNA circulation protein